jgi:hypothetical protein
MWGWKETNPGTSDSYYIFPYCNFQATQEGYGPYSLCLWDRVDVQFPLLDYLQSGHKACLKKGVGRELCAPKSSKIWVHKKKNYSANVTCLLSSLNDL